MQLATEKSPKLTVPYRYLFTGIIILIVLFVWLFFKAQALTIHYYSSPLLLSFTHLLTLGWISITIIGAMFQLVPVITEKNLYSEVIAKIVFYIYIVGLALFIYAFLMNKSPVQGAGIISCGIILFLFDIVLTMKGMRKPDLAVWYVIAALFFLFLTLITGSFAAVQLHSIIVQDPLALLFLHITIAGIGWVCLIVIGFSFRLIPMFILSHGYDETYGWVSFIMFMLGLVLLIIHFLFKVFGNTVLILHLLGLAGGSIILLGIITYILQMYIIYKQRTRRHIEPAIWFSIFATFYLFIAGLIGIRLLAFEHSFRLEMVYIFIGLFGFAGMYIIGMMHKIVPFLQWYNKYSSRIGVEKVPMTKDMISEPLIWIQLFVFNAGMIIMIAGIMTNIAWIVIVASTILLIGSLMFAWNIFNVLKK